MKVSNIYNSISEDERFQACRRILRVFLSSGGSTENDNTGKKYKTRKKAYPNGYGIIKGKMQTDKQNRFQKAETEGQDDMPL
jgi:hypothetical protein